MSSSGTPIRALTASYEAATAASKVQHTLTSTTIAALQLQMQLNFLQTQMRIAASGVRIWVELVRSVYPKT